MFPEQVVGPYVAQLGAMVPWVKLTTKTTLLVVGDTMTMDFPNNFSAQEFGQMFTWMIQSRVVTDYELWI